MKLRTLTRRLTILSLLIMTLCVKIELQTGVAAAVSAQMDHDSKWRKTRFGWTDSSKWIRPARVKFERRIELVHPLVFSAMMVLFCIGALVWATEEYQWARLKRRRRLKLKGDEKTSLTAD